MCFGLEAAWLPALIGSGISAVGTIVQQKQQRKQQQDIADARNNELRRTMQKNDGLAEEGRDRFQKRLAEASNENMEAEKAKTEATRTEEGENAVESVVKPDAAADMASLAGSTSEVVKSDLASRMKEALTQGKDQAKAKAKLSAYGDSWLDQGFADTNAGRDIGVTQNFAAGNSAILPYAQDFAEQRAYRPISPLGGILQGLGGMMGSMGGTGGSLLPRKDAWSGLRQAGASPFMGGS